MGKCDNRSYIYTREYSFMQFLCQHIHNEKKKYPVIIVTTCGFPPRCPFCWVAIVLLLPYRPSCPIAFRPGSVHRPAIARRLSSLESRRQSPLVPSSRPACRIEGRGDALGTGRGRGGERGADAIGGGAEEKPIVVFGNCRQAIEDSTVIANARTAYLPYRPRIGASFYSVFFAISPAGFLFRSPGNRHMR